MGGTLAVRLQPRGELVGTDGVRFLRTLRAAAATSDLVVLDLRQVDALPAWLEDAIAVAGRVLAVRRGTLEVVGTPPGGPGPTGSPPGGWRVS